MLKSRIIPCLLLKNSGLVKTIKFSNSKYIGDPINAIKIFNDKEVDELMVLDITASKENRGPNYDLLEQIAGECYMPLCYGGGITTAEQARRLFELGVEKVCLQTAALKDLKIVEEIRNEEYPIFQDKHGTHIFREKALESFQEVIKLNKFLDVFIIDSIFKDDEYLLEVLMKYKHIINTNNLEESKKYTKIYENDHDSGFLYKKTVYDKY